MEIWISQQLRLFGQSILLGVGTALLYDLLRALRLRLPRFTMALDALYCLAVGGAVFFFILHRAEGILRGYVLFGALGGAVLFFCLFSALLRPLWDFWVDTILFLLQVLCIPVRWVKSFCKKMLVRGKNLFYFARTC